MDKEKTLKCPLCKQQFVLGRTGIDGYTNSGRVKGCDKCLKIERIATLAAEHCAWFPNEEYHIYGNRVITREQARRDEPYWKEHYAGLG